MLQDQMQFSMKRYYEALDVPHSATIDQIKTQYKQLVRVYHPDRFADATAKAQAEERFKAINEAYRALTEIAEQQGKLSTSPKPKPVVDLDLLDFGILYHGDKRTLSFQANNVGEPTVNVNYRFSSTAPWFKVAEIRPLQPDQSVPLLFKVETTLDEVSEAGDYSGLIEINMDGQMVFVHLGMKLLEKRLGWQIPFRKVSYVVIGLLLCTGAVSFALFGSLLPRVIRIPTITSATTNVNEATSRPFLTTSVVEAADGSQDPASGAVVSSDTDSQWSPIYSPDRSQIAFFSNELGSPQIYVRDPQSGKLRQLTRTPEQKTKPVWSPDSLKLAYIASDSESARVHVIDIAQNNVQELVPIALPGIVKHFIWAEDSESVIFDYYIGQEQRFYQGNFKQKETILFVPPDNWDMSWSDSQK